LRTAAACLLVLAAAFLCYAGDFYHADAAALEALNGNGRVQVAREKDGYFFDGPGSDAAFIFYPGAKVECAAYAPLMSALAEAGIDCFLVDMPFNLAFFGLDRADRVMERYGYARWYLGGHSLGGAMAASYAAKNLERLDGLALLAAYPTSSLKAEDFTVLSVYGSEDGVLSREKLSAGADYMPEDFTQLEIPGGNHAWFGSYGEQDGDGRAAITHEDQWAATVQAMAAMALE